VHRALTQARTAGNLALPKVQLKVQAHHFARLTHGYLFPGHWILLSEESTRFMVSSAAIKPIPEPSRSPFLTSPITDRLRTGMVIAFAQEY
jgi:hypothetical protein